MALSRKVQVWIYRQSPAFEVLLLKRANTEKGEWHPITGNVNRHEQVRAAAVREAWEEVTIDIEPEPLGMTFTYDGKRKGDRFHETVFAASTTDMDVELSDEHTEHEWLAPDAAMERLTWDDQKKALESVVARYGPKA